MKIRQTSCILLVGALPTTAAFTPLSWGARRSMSLDMTKIGIFFGTSTGSTEEVAEMIAAEWGEDAEGPFDVETLDGPVKETFEKYESLIVGTPTWNTGADTERSGTGWDEIYYGSMQDLQIQGKNVAVFGLGDQESYAENYADATGELHDVFEGLGCKMMGYTSQEGYEHEDSKSIRGDKFCGLLCDAVNQEELTEGRVQNWVAQLRSEGFFDAASATGTAASPVKIAPNGALSEETITANAFAEGLEEHSEMLDETIESHANTGFTPYYNPKTMSTMWVSADGRTCYYTADSTNTSVSP